MNDKDYIVMWLVGFIFLAILAVFTAPLLVEGAVNTGIDIGQLMSEEK